MRLKVMLEGEGEWVGEAPPPVAAEPPHHLRSLLLEDWPEGWI